LRLSGTFSVQKSLMTSPAQRPTEPSIVNLPNLLAGIRLVGSVAAIGVVLAERPLAFLLLLGFLMLTDWLDGKLAILLEQQTTFGAQLDSLADAAMYAVTLFGCLWLRFDLVRQEAYWIVIALISYAITSLAGLLKFGRIPSYHTRAAKSCWLLVGIAVVALFLGKADSAWTAWPLRVASMGVTLTNLEATAITVILPEWRANVSSFWQARRDRATDPKK
jgi:cardiolipin synthase (CMP-forming)